ncbi:MAG: HDOD domain-containing protein [Anaerolineales bacterium]|nr:HDOD domain-containing protein [Anaerolineales bacterium]
MGDTFSSFETNFPTRVLQPGVLPNIFIGRQPIFDRYLRVIGYELLYRNRSSDLATFFNGDEATSRVILNTFAEIGLEDVVGRQKAFINLTRNFFLEKYPIPFTPRQLVIEVPETLVLDKEILEHIQEFSQKGYQIALDDVTSLTSIKSLLNVADIIKLDLSLIPPEKIQPLAYRLQFQRAKLLAEKVETREQFDLCMQAGFDYFQGFFLCRPNLVSGRKIPSSRLVLMQLLAKLQNPDVGFDELEYILSEDAILGYKLLRLTNSAYYGIRSEIKSIRQAMTLLGLEKLRSWLSLILLAEKHDKPRELTILAMLRARMSELLAQNAKLAEPESYFLAGLLSALDAIMDTPLEELLESLRLSTSIKEGLIESKGMIGQAIQCVLAYERAEWEKVSFLQLSNDLIRDIYLQSLHWVETMRKALNIMS